MWARSAKRIELPEQARAALGIEDAVLTPNEVIHAILQAPVDVLWNGGIGTVVKASTETDAEALDRSSDAIRVDATELRCRVVAEGGNLGLTQRARIEFAREGGLINADFIDNSAGVDCSDHEVNLKVLLDLAVRRGELDAAERDALLAEVTDDVAAHVLYDSFLQAQMLAQEVRGSATRMFAYEDLMAALEAEGLLQREVEFLPSSEEMADRRRSGRGLERPELAVLLAYAKRSLTGALLRSSLPDDAYLEGDLRGYFPPAVVERLGHLLAEHPLRRELVATIVSNHVVNALGPTFVSRLVAEQGAEPADVVRAYRIARDVTGAEQRWAAVEQLTGVDRQAQWTLLEGIDELVEATARWYLENAPGADLGTAIATGREGFGRLLALLPKLDERREALAGAAAELVEQGVPDDDGPRPRLPDGAGLRPRRHRRRRIGRAQRRGRRHGLRPARGPRADRLDRGAARRAAGEHADAALGACRPCATTSGARAASWPARRSTTRPARRSRTPSSASWRPIPTRCSASPTWRARWRGRAAPTSPASPWRSGSCARSRAEAALARQPRAHDEAAPDRPRPQLAAAQRDALAHADQPLPAAREPVDRGAVGDAVGDLDLEHLRRPAQDDTRPAAAAVLERVGQALLHEPEGGQVDAGRQRPGRAPRRAARRRARRRASGR